MCGQDRACLSLNPSVLTSLRASHRLTHPFVFSFHSSFFCIDLHVHNLALATQSFLPPFPLPPLLNTPHLQHLRSPSSSRYIEREQQDRSCRFHPTGWPLCSVPLWGRSIYRVSCLESAELGGFASTPELLTRSSLPRNGPRTRWLAFYY